MALIRKTSTDKYTKNMVLGGDAGKTGTAQTWGTVEFLEYDSKPGS